MPTSFQNMATLTYTGGTVNSNIVTGELREVLTAAKTAVRENYEPGGTVTYVVSLTNSGITPLTGLTISDNLGGYCIRLDLGDLKKIVSLMRYASNNLNQYAKKANETGNIYMDDIQDLQLRFNQIWAELKEIHIRLANIE